MRRLGEDWRGIASIAVVDRSGSQRFKQRRSEGKLDPSDPHALGFKALFKDLLLFHDQKRADFLIADAQFPSRVQQRSQGRRMQLSATTTP